MPLIAIIDWEASPLDDTDGAVERDVIGDAARVKRFLCSSDADFNDEICGADALIVWHNTPITANGLSRLRNCKVLVRNGVGFDSVDTIENITIENRGRDGVHVNGPASDGLIRGVRGDPHDDNVALNAWEWKNYAPGYGTIERIVIEDITGAPQGVPAANSIRILPGVKRFDDGTQLDCPLENSTLRRSTDIREFKVCDQPNLEMGHDKDFSSGVGSFKDLRFEDIVFNRPGKIELHANTDGLVIRNVEVNHPITEDWHLLAIGPKSQTYKGGQSEDPVRWTEIFSPDFDCTVRNVSITRVRTRNSQTDLPIEQVVKVIELKPNPDYPRTTPKGGTGKGIWIR